MLKTCSAWSTQCPTAALMNGHSDTQTKLRLDLYYAAGSGVTQSTDRSRNHMNAYLSLSSTESLPTLGFMQTKMHRGAENKP